jgi:dCTP deaminase
MILSNLEIQKALDEGRLVIEPEPSPRKPEHGKYCPYDNATSVDLRLHNEISVPKGGTFAYDLTEPGAISEQIAKNSEKIVLRRDQPYKLERGKFVLGWTLERVELSIKNGLPYLAARIEGKSSRARCGLLVHFTAPTVHTGWSGRLTLEMINLGPATFLLSPEMPIAQLIVEQVCGEVMLKPSQFQNQTTPEGLR